VRQRGAIPGAAPSRGVALAGRVVAAAALVLAAGCSQTNRMVGFQGPGRGGSVPTADVTGPTAVARARAAIASGDFLAADMTLTEALAPPDSGKDDDKDKDEGGPTIRQNASTAELLVVRAELRIRQGRFPEAESDALTAMAMVPATPTAAEAATEEKKNPLTQRSIHIRLAQLYEDAGRDDDAEQHLAAARELCQADAALVEERQCDREREALVRIRVARGHYAEAEPLVLAEIAEVQAHYGADDIRLAVAMCNAAHFYARQGKYALSGPLYSRSFDLWRSSREEAFAEQQRAVAAGQPSPFDADFLRPRAGHLPFAAPCGLEDQPDLLYKIGKPSVAADAVRYQQQLWADDTEAGAAAIAALDADLARSADPLDVASARHAVAFVAERKGDAARAEQELRAVSEAYAAAWPSLATSERRYRAEDYLTALESLIEVLRSSRRFAEATALGDKAEEVASASVDAYDSLRLDTLLSEARTAREMRDPDKAEAAAGRYLDAIVSARGDRSADYAWALRTISYAYLLKDELDASQRMEMQAKAIWAKQDTVAPEF
jgi:hypothetical protein